MVVKAGLVTIAVLLVPPVVAMSWRHSQATLPHRLERTCAMIRQHLPVLVDANTRLDAISTNGRALIYEYTIIAMTDANALLVKDSIKNITAAQINADDSQKILLDQGATFSLHYRNQGGRDLFAIDVDKTTPVIPGLARMDPLDQALYIICADTSKRTPVALDKHTTLTSVSQQHHGLEYRYAMTGLSDSTAIGLKDLARAGMLEQMSGNAAVTQLLHLGATFTYSYVNASGTSLFHYALTKASQEGPQDDPLNRTLMLLCMNVNHATPRLETREIRLDSAVPKNHGITYCYTVLTTSSTPMDRLAAVCKRNCSQTLHATSALLLNDGATFSYVFRNLNGVVLFTFDVVK